MLEYTREQLVAVHKERLDELILFADTYYYLAKMLRVSPSTVQGWMERGRISKAGAKRVESNKALTQNFKANYLRPDL
jgi:hypothetical protein